MLITITGPSGSGKNFIKEKIFQKFPSIKELVWLTTRSLRNDNHESNRINVSNEKFEEMMRGNQLILVQKLYDNFYGLKKDSLLIGNGMLFTEFHIDNFLEAVNLELDLFSIALIPATLSVIETRLIKRETENFNQIKDRIDAAKEEVKKIEVNRTLFSIVIDFSGDFEESSITELIRRVDLTMKGGL